MQFLGKKNYTCNFTIKLLFNVLARLVIAWLENGRVGFCIANWTKCIFRAQCSFRKKWLSYLKCFYQILYFYDFNFRYMSHICKYRKLLFYVFKMLMFCLQSRIENLIIGGSGKMAFPVRRRCGEGWRISFVKGSIWARIFGSKFPLGWLDLGLMVDLMSPSTNSKQAMWKLLSVKIYLETFGSWKVM